MEKNIDDVLNVSDIFKIQKSEAVEDYANILPQIQNSIEQTNTNLTIKRDIQQTRNDGKKGHIKFESTMMPITPNIKVPQYKLPGPECNTLVSEYRIVLKRDWTPGAVSVTEYAQNDNS
jgi:hypothetical protein